MRREESPERDLLDEAGQALFAGVFTGLVLYALSLTPLWVWPSVVVFVLTGCCLHCSCVGQTVFLASLLVMMSVLSRDVT